ncbi:hypothetical protein [Caproiciproducens faecalis]|uniref:DUF2127 domain-containing protein n=1 Tax=Caproiciproducens faecalis TaxID=2820301 RepID=A0ABS7DQL8_9FIRM|nr:hypothetical protein [Caproiciproducens faecalis]MBW7573581.1 hypothetical protein [Caproiciproducens faecalis]
MQKLLKQRNASGENNPSALVPFVLFGVVMFSVNIIQYSYRFYSRQVFLALLSLQEQNIKSPELDNLWKTISHAATMTEIIYYITGIAFFIWIGYQLVKSRISIQQVLLCTVLMYALSIAIFLPLQISHQEGNLLAPVLISFAFSLLQIFFAWIRHRKCRTLSGN